MSKCLPTAVRHLQPLGKDYDEGHEEERYHNLAADHDVPDPKHVLGLPEYLWA